MKKCIASFLCLVALTAALVAYSPAQAEVEQINQTNAVVVADVLNLRAGCGIQYAVVATIKNGGKLQVLGENEGWLMVYVPETGMVGAVEKTYVTIDTPTAGEPTMGQEEKKLLDAINQVRNLAGLPDLQMDEDLSKIALLKARDMSDNKYFGHTSEKYGTPFKMMKDYGISFGAAGENIAGNTSVEKALESWTDSEEHIRNIINDKYSKIGIGIVEDKNYGKIIVLEFTD